MHARRQELQADLNRQRGLWDRLAERLRELDDLSIDSDAADSSDADGEDLLGAIIQTPSESLDSRSPDRRTRASAEDRDDDDADDADDNAAAAEATQKAPPPSHSATATSGPPGTTASAAPAATQTAPPPSYSATDDAAAGAPGLRARAPGTATAPPDGADTAETTGRQRLFGDRRETAADKGLRAAATTDDILQHQGAEQENISELLHGMALKLKANSLAFGHALEEDKNTVQAAGAGLDRNERGLEAAARRMGTLRRMSEGKGWFGRMMLYAWIFGLMVVAVLLVFVLPKLRF